MFSVPEIQYPMQMRLGAGVLFLGYDLNSDAARPGDTLQLTLYWQALEEMAVSYTVFTHLLDSEEQVWGQMDSVPLSGEAPTTSWVAGEVIADPYEIIVDADTRAGDYVIEIGMYDATTGLRLPVVDASGQPKDDRVLLQQSMQVLAAEGE